MKKLSQTILGILVCLAEAAVGVLLLIDPISFTAGIIKAAGIVLLLSGVISAVKYFLTAPAEAAKRQLLLKGLLSIVLGGFLTFNSGWLLVAFPMLGVLYGLVVFLGGLGKVQWAIDRLRMKESRWFLGIIGAVISVVCGAVILANPFTSASVLWIFAGVSLIIEAVFDLVAIFYQKKPAADEAEDPDASEPADEAPAQ